MWDHPFGVGWNNAVSTYEKKYSPPEGGALAITTNDYLMIGTELGIPALLCFITYVAICLRGKRQIKDEDDRIRAACRAGAIVLLVAFWFDGGLFKLSTAAVFWILLELGSERQMLKAENRKSEIIQQSEIGNRKLTRVSSPRLLQNDGGRGAPARRDGLVAP